MHIEGLIPARILSPLALATIFTLMFHLGTMVTPSDFRGAWRSPARMLKAIFCSVVAVPIIVIVVARAFDLPRSAQVGMVLMAICPGAPVALRRAIGAGGEATFGLALQVSLAILAVVTVPVSIAALDEVYAGSASIEPWRLALQVSVMQLLPLGLGIAARERLAPRRASIEPLIVVLVTTLLLVLLALAMINVWRPVVGAGGRVALAIAISTMCVIGLGHMLGGPSPSGRTSLAVACAARNAGLALVVAFANSASPEIMAAVLAYLVVSALTATPYVVWRSRAASGVRRAGTPRDFGDSGDSRE